MTRRDVGFTCSGSADYLTGGTFTFVQMLEAAGAWPPISESHVEMDGAWALYEAWVRLQHGDVDVALVFASGRASLGVSLRETLTFQLDPYYLAPIGADYVSLAALQGQAVLARDARSREGSRRDRRRSAARTRPAIRMPRSRVRRAPTSCSPPTTWSRRCARTTSARRSTVRPRSCSSPATGPARCATGRRGSPASTTASTRTIRACAISRARRRRRSPANARAWRTAASRSRSSPRCARPKSWCSPRRSGLGDDVVVNPSGGALVANPVMVTGLVRIGEAFRQVHDHGRQRVPGPRVVGSVPATEPRVRVGGTGLMAERCAVVGIGMTKMAKCRDDLSMAGLVREAAVRALADAEMTWNDIDAVVIGTAPDIFEGVMMPELYLADALGAAGQADHARAHRGQRRRLDRGRRDAPHRVARARPRAHRSRSRSSRRATPTSRSRAAAAGESAPAATSRRTSARTSSGRARPTTSARWWR